jgi:glycosyltransferase involved in cell wall biosynthesis
MKSMTRLQIAFDARHLTGKVLRGMDRYTVGLVRQLVTLGVEVTLFYREREPLNPAHVNNLGCQLVGLKDLGGLYWEQIAVPIALYQRGIDLYHAPAERGVPLLAPCPVVFTIHSVTGDSYYHLVESGRLPGRVSDYLGYDFDPKRRGFWEYLFRLQVARADRIITPSEFCRQEVIEFLNIKPERVETTHLAVHEQFTKPPRAAAEREIVLQSLGIHQPYLLYVGGYEPHKNADGLLETFAIVKQMRPDLMLVAVGSGELPDRVSHRTAALNLQVGSDVIFLVDLTDELTDLYDAAELFVSLSWRETFCLPALEALTRGVAVVGSEWGALPEIIGDTGRVVAPCNFEGAATAIIEVLATDRTNLARQQARHFSWERTTERTLAVYRELCPRSSIDWNFTYST